MRESLPDVAKNWPSGLNLKNTLFDLYRNSDSSCIYIFKLRYLYLKDVIEPLCAIIVLTGVDDRGSQNASWSDFDPVARSPWYGCHWR